MWLNIPRLYRTSGTRNFTSNAEGYSLCRGIWDFHSIYGLFDINHGQEKREEGHVQIYGAINFPYETCDWKPGRGGTWNLEIWGWIRSLPERQIGLHRVGHIGYCKCLAVPLTFRREKMTSSQFNKGPAYGLSAEVKSKVGYVMGVLIYRRSRCRDCSIGYHKEKVGLSLSRNN